MAIYLGRNRVSYSGVKIIKVKASSVSGTSRLKLTKTIGDEIENMVMHGNSVQAESDNLFDKTSMLSGFLPQSGTYPTTNSSYPDARYQIIDIKAEQTFRITYTGIDANQGRIRYIDSDTNKVVGFVGNSTNEYFSCTTSFGSGFENGEITAIKDFKLGIMYLRTLPTDFNLQIKAKVPMPETPIEVESVGVLSKNLCGGNNVLLNTLIGNSANGNMGESSAYHTLFMPVQEGETYTFTNFVRADGSSLKGCYYDENKKWAGAFEETTITIPSGVKYVGRSFNQTVTKVQLEKGDTATEYEPYGYKVPIKASGENLINPQNITGLLSQGGTDGAYMVSSTTYKGLIFKCNPNTKYTFAQSYSTGRTRVFLYNEYPSGSSIMSTSGWIYDNRLQHTFTTHSDTQYLGISLGTNDKFTSDYKIWLVEGDYAEYEPYIEPRIINIYLNEPLRKIGDYTDYIDYKNKKVVRRIATKVFDGTEQINELTSTIKYNYIALGSFGLVVDDVCLCTHLQHQANFYYMVEGNNKFRVLNSTANNQARIVFRFYLNGEIVSDVNQVKALLKEYYSSGNPMIVYYAHADGLEKEKIIQFPQIKNNWGNTIYTIETKVEPSQTNIDYWERI